MNPISPASSGLLAASARFGQTGGAVVAAAANTGANPGANPGGGALAAAIVGQAGAAVQLQAAANVQKVSDQMIATLLDITA